MAVEGLTDPAMLKKLVKKFHRSDIEVNNSR